MREREKKLLKKMLLAAVLLAVGLGVVVGVIQGVAWRVRQVAPGMTEHVPVLFLILGIGLLVALFYRDSKNTPE